ncbi:MAG: TlyA family RNA methyltransferase [Parasporobacterium sp.]|nr:TlyA family RNA methyltransferase [Parasporobacterium sp.]
MKKRLDELVCMHFPEFSKTRAQAVIMSGVVYVNDQKETKAGSMFPEDVLVEVRGETLKYVSRGGLKLEKAMAAFDIKLDGKICMDIGSSTGGFTDCMLQNGASKVYCVDVGKGQLHYKLRNDPRVVVMEKTNIRYVTPDQIDDKLNFASVDVSFISLTLVVPAAYELLDENKELVMLIKPQFEAGRDKVGKKGVVREPETHIEVIKKVVDFVTDKGLSVAGLTYSPVKGPEGNIEYLIHVNSHEGMIPDDSKIKEIVEAAHAELDK